MPNISFSFTVSSQFHNNLSNHEIFAIRREIANIMEFSEFGRVTEIDVDKFANVFATPTTDAYFQPENELFVSYSFNFPLEHGNIPVLIMQGFPRLKQIIEEQLNLEVISRVVFN